MANYSELSDEALRAGIDAGKKRTAVVAVIFGVIILAWLLLGYWRSNTPIFVITVVLAGMTLLLTSRTSQQMAAELQKRREEN